MKDKGTILVVEDTPADLELLVDTLTAEGYQVLPAASGELALASLAAQRPELILLDIRLPGLNGFEVCRRLKARPESRDIPVVFISVNGERAERVEGLKLGAVDYITKPFEREELLARVQNQLELGRLRVRLEQQAADLRQTNEQLQCELAERKQRELEIQRQAAFPRLNPNPVLELSAAGEINYSNRAAEATARALGLGGPAQMLPPATAAVVRECLATGQPTLRVETQIGPRVMSWSFFPVQQHHTVHCYGGDITERKRTEEQLRASQQIIEGILNAIPVRVFWKDTNLVYLGCNVSFAHDAGFSDPKEVVGKDDYHMGWSEQAELYRSDDRQVIESGRSKLLIEESQTTPEGNTITLLTNKMPLRNAEGEVSGVLGTYMHITERKQAEEVLRERMELQDQLFHIAATVPGMIYSLLMRPDGSIRMPYASGVLSRIFDLQPKDVIENAAPIFSLIHPDDIGHVMATITESARTLNPWRDDFRVRHTRLGEIWVEGHSVPQREPDGSTLWHGFVQDITERKRAEERVQQSEGRLRAITNSAQDAILMMDPEGKVTYWNPAAERILGYTSAEALGQNLHDLIAPARFHPAHHTAFAAFHQTGQGAAVGKTVELEARRKDSQEISVQLSLSAVQMNGGWHAVGLIRDITERKRSEERLRLQSAALEAAANGVVITGPQGTIQWVNPAFTQLTGYSAAEAIGQNPRVLKSGQHPESYYKELWQTVSAGHVWKGEIINRRKDGQLYYEEMTITPVRDSAGAVSHFVAIKQDISQRKQAEKELLKKEQLLSEAQRLGHIGSWFFDTTGPMRWSEELYRLYGVSPDTFTPTEESLIGLMHPDDRPAMRAWMAACAAGEKPGESEFRVNLPDGTIRWIRGHGDAVHDAGNRLIHIAGTAQDITERKAGEARLAGLQKELLAASRQAGMAEVATNVLHNVGNVLNSVNISTTLIVQSVKQSRASSLARVVALLQEHAPDLGEFITNDSRGKHVPAHLAQLSEHLLAEQETNLRELASLRRNVEHIKEIVAMQQNYASFGGVKEMINVVDLVEDSLRLNEGAFNRHDVEVIREFEPVPPLNLEKHKFLQIMVNLLRNAKHACQDSERADKRLTVRVTNGEGRIRVSVIDNGVGIPPENLTRIFNYGFTTRKDGHGFGLHSGALAAKEMGGSLVVHSDGPGQGAAFTLELPCPERDNSHS